MASVLGQFGAIGVFVMENAEALGRIGGDFYLARPVVVDELVIAPIIAGFHGDSGRIVAYTKKGQYYIFFLINI